jgi:hypothetical protein
VWIERGSPKKGYDHMVGHADDFKDIGILPEQLPELVQAATSVGYFFEFQSRRHLTPRPIYGLYFYNQAVAVAVTVAENGYVVGLNRSSMRKMKKKNKVYRCIF